MQCCGVSWCFHTKGQHMENTLWSAQPPQHPFKNGLQNTKLLDACVHFYRLCKCACAGIGIIAQGSEDSARHVRAWGVQSCQSGGGKGMLVWAWSAIARLSACGDGLTWAQQTCQRDDWAKSPRGATIWSEWHPHTRLGTGAVPRLLRAWKVKRKTGEEGSPGWYYLWLEGSFELFSHPEIWEKTLYSC